MLVYRLAENHLAALSERPSFNRPDQIHLCFLDFDGLAEQSSQLAISAQILGECLNGGSSKFESHEGFDFINLTIPETLSGQEKPSRICIYFRSNLLVFVSDRLSYFSELVATSQASGIHITGLSKFFHLFFDHLTYDDRNVLVAIEEEISDLEEQFIVAIKNDLVDYLITFRKRLLGLKQYYEQLFEISEAIEDNENNLIDQADLRYFKILTNRINRLFTAVLNLRDYGTQVREAYQAQMDINLNNVMKLFTVITSIFLPLTLIVGWYGMNIMMPEFHWEYGYPFVIVLCVAVVTVTLLYFKKNKWF